MKQQPLHNYGLFITHCRSPLTNIAYSQRLPSVSSKRPRAVMDVLHLFFVHGNFGNCFIFVPLYVSIRLVASSFRRLMIETVEMLSITIHEVSGSVIKLSISN